MKEILIDRKTADTHRNMLWRGAGMVSANNSSRLLMDYKKDHPDSYWRILGYIFGEKGIRIEHLKIEMGSDINSSSGTEPCVKRFSDEKADVTRGAGLMLCHDAKQINPGLTLDMLWWGEPKWIEAADDVYDTRYRWYKETLDAAYEKFGVIFDYVSVTQNERAHNVNWIKYFAKRLKAETDCPYDYAAIKIVTGEEVCTWGFAENMKDDAELRDLIDIIGSHYTSSSSDTAKELADRYGKELWVSEGSSPMRYSGTYRFNRSSLSGLNGALDIADRIIAMYPMGRMTMYEYQPVVSAYYDGVCYGFKQLILANTPWNGGFSFDAGFYTALHFSQFIKKGWAFVGSACNSDCVTGGDGHCLENGHYTYMTCAEPSSGEHSTVITNTTDDPIDYHFTVTGYDRIPVIHVYLSTGHDENGGHFLVKQPDVIPAESDEGYTFSITVPPLSIVTVSTVDPKIDISDNKNDSILSLPYEDKFVGDDLTVERGGAPAYTSDQGGAFEIQNGYLTQMITENMRPAEWGYTPDPVTSLGDDRWYNYSVSIDTALESREGYAGIGLRYSLGCIGQHGFRLCISDGKWQLMENDRTLAEGRHDADVTLLNRVKISACCNTIRAYLNNKLLAEYTAKTFTGAGRAAIYSSYHNNIFSDLLIEPEKDPYIRRYDDTDEIFTYHGEWKHDPMASFHNYKRTLSTGKAGASVKLSYTGDSFAIFGKSAPVSLRVIIDGIEEIIRTDETSFRDVSVWKRLDHGEHEIIIHILEGDYSIDGVEITI